MSKETEEKEIKAAEENLANVQNALGKAEQFLEDNQKAFAYGAIAIIALVAIVWCLRTQYFEPREQEAQKEMFAAQYNFEADSFNLALNGDALNSGFLKVIDEYGSTKAGELANYYAGVCYLQLGDFENAKKYLSDYDGEDPILASYAVGLCGDAESELGNYDAAVSLYKKSVGMGNKVVAPIFLQKLGLLYEKLGKPAEAKAAYAEIEESYPNSVTAPQAAKYMQSVKE